MLTDKHAQRFKGKFSTVNPNAQLKARKIKDMLLIGTVLLMCTDSVLMTQEAGYLFHFSSREWYLDPQKRF